MGLPAPAYQDETCTLYQGDALQLMPELAPALVQLIIADVPYWKQKLDYLGKRLDWDRQWPTREVYLIWLRQMAQEWRRVLAPNGSLYVFAAPTMAAHVEVLLEEYFTVLNRITWLKDDGWHKKAEKEQLRSYLSPWEAILFCEQRHSDAMALGESGCSSSPLGASIQSARRRCGLRGTDIDIRLGYTRTKEPHRGTELCRRWEEGSSIPSFNDYCRALRACGDIRLDEALRTEYEALRRPFTVTPSVPYTDVWSFNTVPAATSKHAAEKPLALLRHIIEVSSRPGDIVLDPTAGSCSTLDAARQCGRRSIGIELEAASIALGQQRLAQQLLPWETP